MVVLKSFSFLGWWGVFFSVTGVENLRIAGINLLNILKDVSCVHVLSWSLSRHVCDTSRDAVFVSLVDEMSCTHVDVLCLSMSVLLNVAIVLGVR